MEELGGAAVPAAGCRAGARAGPPPKQDAAIHGGAELAGWVKEVNASIAYLAFSQNSAAAHFPVGVALP